MSITLMDSLTFDIHFGLNLSRCQGLMIAFSKCSHADLRFPILVRLKESILQSKFNDLSLCTQSVITWAAMCKHDTLPLTQFLTTGVIQSSHIFLQNVAAVKFKSS